MSRSKLLHFALEAPTSKGSESLKYNLRKYIFRHPQLQMRNVATTTGLWHSTYTPAFSRKHACNPESDVSCASLGKPSQSAPIQACNSHDSSSWASPAPTLLKRLVNYADRALKMLPARPPGGTVLIAQEFLQLGAAQLWQTESMCSLLQHNWTMSSKVSPLPAKPNKTTQPKGQKLKYAQG